MHSGWQPECASLCPSSTQELLLRAAASEGDAARESFRSWKQATGFVRYSNIDFSSSRLLPAVYQNFRRQGIDDAWLPQMGALHRYHWLRNTRAQHRLLELADGLAQVECGYLLLGGFALLASGYYDDLGERPLLETELLVPIDEAARARSALASLGWCDAAAAPAPVTGWRSEWWRTPDGQSLRIHFRWLPKPFPVVPAGRLLEHSELIEMNGLRLRIPDAADMLTYTCIANRRPARDGSHRFTWALAALRIIARAGERLDWNRLAGESRSLCAQFPLTESLGYLVAAFGASLPTAWQTATAGAGIRPAEKQAFYRCTRQWSHLARAIGPRTLLWLWDDYTGAEESARRKPTAMGLLAYWRWHLTSELKRARRLNAFDGNEPAAEVGPTSQAA